MARRHPTIEGRAIAIAPPVWRLTRALRAALFAVAGVIACRGADSPIEPPRLPTTIERVSGDAQSGIAGSALPAAPTVRVLDRHDIPFANAEVHFTILDGEGATTDTVVRTDAAGRASVTWFMGPDPSRAQRLRAVLSGAAGPSAVTEFTAQAARPTSGATMLGRYGYIEYQPGDLPIILSAPHGGTLEPAEIPDRTAGTLVRDTNTEELARVVADVLEERTGERPHLVLTLLRRTKVDTNREVVEAAQGHPHAERAWFEFQSWLETASAVVQQEHGAGLYIDLHGHGHTIQRVEIGYLLTASDLALGDAALDAATYVRKSSVRAIGESAAAGSFSSLVRGPRSFGALLAASGFRAVPSPDDPHPAGEPYFNGGYNTARHGSRDGGAVSGFQLELNWTGVRDTEASRRAFAEALADALLVYLEERLGIVLAPVAP